MKTKKVTRHYCDFCHKGLFQKPRMIHHENVCTKNINRFCGMCNDFAGKRDFSKLVLEMKDKCKEIYNLDELVGLGATEESINWLKQKVDGCPACMLTVLRLGKIWAHEFNYKKQHEEFWKEQRDLEKQNEEFSTY